MGLLKYPAHAQPVFESRARTTEGTTPHPFGARGEDNFGRTYRYCGAGGTALVVGDLIQSAAELTNHQVRQPVAAAIGANTIDIALGSTAITINQYDGGIAIIDTTPGFGYSYPIDGHPTADSGATTFVMALASGWSIQVALTTTSRVTIIPSPYQDVIQSPTTETGAAVGVAQFIIAIGEFGWIAVGGHFGVLMDGNIAAGNSVARSDGTNGAVEIGNGVLQVVGAMLETGVTGQLSGVQLNMH